MLLDEPAEGLDPQGIRELRELILQLNREHGMTIVLSSYLLSEVQQICSRIAILNKGRLVFQGRWEELARDQARYRLDVDDWTHAAAMVAAGGASLDLETKIVSLPSVAADAADLVAALVGAGVRVRAVEPVRQNLEDVYLQTIGEEAAPTRQTSPAAN